MTEVSFSNVRIRGIAAAVPEQVRTLAEDALVFGSEEVQKVSASTGVKQRHISASLTTSDLCQAAAERLLTESEASPDDIDALIFISQTPDFPLPASGCCLQSRLGLPTSCAAFDVSLGCSGYVYGLWLAYSLVASGAATRILILAGDTISRMCAPRDRSVALLFGDAGTATLVEHAQGAERSVFVLGTDGAGEAHLKVPAGGYRMKFSPDAVIPKACEGGNWRSLSDLYMNGAEIFSFTLREVPPLIRRILAHGDLTIADVDYFVFHQANQFMLDHLFKRMKLPAEKCVLGLELFGNTSSASIPLAIVTRLREHLRHNELKLVLAGFGVGFSWGGAKLSCGPITVPEIALVPDPTTATP